MIAKIFISIFILFGSLAYSQEVFEITKIGRKKSVFVKKNDLISIKYPNDSDEVLKVLAYRIQRIENDTLYAISCTYDYTTKETTCSEEAIAINKIDKIGYSPKDCHSSVLIFLGPIVILGSPFMAINQNGDFMVKNFIIGLSVGIGIRTLTYFLLRGCNIVTYDLDEKWEIKPALIPLTEQDIINFAPHVCAKLRK